MLSRIVSRSVPSVQRHLAPAIVRSSSVALTSSAAAVRTLRPTIRNQRGFASQPTDAQLSNVERIVDRLGSLPARNNSVVVTASGPDRPGLVHEMIKALTAAGANIEESRMAVLGPEFAILVRCTITDDFQFDKVKSDLERDFTGFAIGVRPVKGTASPFTDPVRIMSVQVEGPDQPGVVQALTKIFVDMKGNVRDLDTDSSTAPFAGYKIFQLKCVVAFPMKTDFEKFEESLKEFEDQFGFEVSVHEGMNQDMDEEMDEDEDEDSNMDEDEDDEEPEPPRRVASPAAGRRGPPPPPAGPAGRAPPRGPPMPPPGRPAPAAPRGPAAPARAPQPPPRGPPRR